ncbi:MAG: 2-phospho-L-lactate guanylyltransferase [Chloroflexi bacterium]|nr:2-phospho-L-lactate guanylyltransferase [Chloroflexota bacterium]
MIAALIPAKSLDEAKGRLAGLLSDDERRQLTLAMLEDIVRTLQAVPRIDSISIVSPDAEVLGKARELDANAIEEPTSVRGINQALSHGAKAISTDTGTLLVILADVPAVTPSEIEAIIDAIPSGKGLVICPSAAKGTSALALRPPGAIPFRFGPDSFSAHKREALASGLSTKVVRFDSLSNDIDEPDNLRELLAHPAESATHHLLAQMRVSERLG